MQKTTFKPKFIAAFVALNLSPMAFAGQVYSGVDYQYFRDFAENKGKFTPGAQNIEVVNKKRRIYRHHDAKRADDRFFGG